MLRIYNILHIRGILCQNRNLMGSKSDFKRGKTQPVSVIKSFGVEVEVRVISAHRTPEEAHEFPSAPKRTG